MQSIRGNLSHKGMRLFSWSTCILEKAVIRGKKICFADPQGHSSYTSRHRSHSMRALPSEWTLLTVPTVHGKGHGSLLPRYGSHKQWARKQVAELIRLADEHMQRSKRCRKQWSIESEQSQASKCLADARLYAELFDKRIKVLEIKGLDAICKRARERAEAEEKARQKARQKALAIENKEKIKRWLSGDTSVFFPSGVSKVLLRVRQGHLLNEETGECPKEIETSQHVTIPYADGERCFRFAIARRSKGWKRNGERFTVGQYALDAVSEAGIVCGCHHITWPIIEAFAKAEGWVK